MLFLSALLSVDFINLAQCFWEWRRARFWKEAGLNVVSSVVPQPHPRQLPTSDQQAKQRAEAVKQAQLFFAQSKPSPTCGGNPAEEGKGPSPPPVHGSNSGATAASAVDSKDEDKKPAPAKEAPLEE